MLAVALRADGWRVEYLGADTPGGHGHRLRRADRCDDARASALPAGSHSSRSAHHSRTTTGGADRPDRDRWSRVHSRDRAGDRCDLRQRQPHDRRGTAPPPRESVSPWVQAGLAGATAAAAWGLVEPLDQRWFRFPYSDIAILGKFATRGPHWRAVGWTMHIVNGAVAGLVFWALFEWLGTNAFWFAIAFAMVEHLVTYPLTLLTDRFIRPGVLRSCRRWRDPAGHSLRRPSAICCSASCSAFSSRSEDRTWSKRPG